MFKIFFIKLFVLWYFFYFFYKFLLIFFKICEYFMGPCINFVDTCRGVVGTIVYRGGVGGGGGHVVYGRSPPKSLHVFTY